MNKSSKNTVSDWDNIPESKLTSLQKLAKNTHGIATISNLLSVSGLIIVIFGLIEIYNLNWTIGLIAVAIGRSFDAIDGFIASKTGTKSRLGEAFDTTCDKLGILGFLITASLMSSFSAFLIFILLVHHSYVALYGLLFGRKHNIHPKKVGKLAMLFSWIAIIVSIANASAGDNSILNALTITFTAIYSAFAMASIYAYSQEFRKI